LRIGWGRRNARGGLIGVTLGEGLAIATVERVRDARPRLLGCSWMPTPEPLGERELRAERQRLKLGRQRVNSVLEADEYQLLLVEAPRVEPTELRAAVRWRVKEMIDFHIDDAVIDVFEIPGQQQRGQGQAMMYAVVAKMARIRSRIGLLEGADLRLEVIDIPELALRNIAALAPEDASGLVTLQLGARSGLITLTRQQNLFLARRIDSGGQTLLEAAAGSDAPEADEYGAVAQLVDSIVLEIQRSIDYYDRHFAQPPLAAVAVAPPGPGLDWLDEQLNRRLGLPVRRLDLNEMLDAAAPLDEATQARCLLAVGAALREEDTAL
jgi:MSHA biogenesis protein MshI